MNKNKLFNIIAIIDTNGPQAGCEAWTSWPSPFNKDIH